MADYVEQDLNLRLAGQPWTSAKASADAENLIAVAEGATGSPFAVYGWHPYDADLVARTGSGIVYDSGTDGTVASVTFPDLSEYEEAKILIDGVTFDTSSRPMNVEYKNEAGTWQKMYETSHFGTSPTDAILTIYDAPEPLEAKVDGLFGALVGGVGQSPGERIVAIRLVANSANIDGGVMKMKTRAIMATE